MLTFNDERHEYRWNDVIVPGVTSILKPLVSYDHIPPAVLETARQKGVACHRMVELDCKGDLDENGLPEWMRPALVNWRKFVAESGFEMLKSEYRVFHPIYKFAGTMDLFGRMGAGNMVFIDVKRSFAAGPVIGLQLAAYKDAYIAQEQAGSGTKAAKRYALKLSEAGPYRLEQFADNGDFATFLSLLAIANFKRKYSL